MKKSILFSPSSRRFFLVFIAITLVLALSVAVTGCSAPKAQIVKVSADEALKILKDQPNATLLDVRTPEEYAAGHIEKASNIPVETFSKRVADLPQDKKAPVIVYCHSGRRSNIAAKTLIDMGYTAVYDLGGLMAWPYEIVS